MNLWVYPSQKNINLFIDSSDEDEEECSVPVSETSSDFESDERVTEGDFETSESDESVNEADSDSFTPKKKRKLDLWTTQSWRCKNCPKKTKRPLKSLKLHLKAIGKKGVHKKGRLDVTIICGCSKPILINFNFDAFKETEKGVKIYQEAENLDKKLHRKLQHDCDLDKRHFKIKFS